MSAYEALSLMIQTFFPLPMSARNCLKLHSVPRALMMKREKSLELITKQQANTAYLAKLEESIEEARNGEVYQFWGKGKFNETPHGVDL